MFDSITILKSATLFATEVTYSNVGHVVYTIALDMLSLNGNSLHKKNVMLVVGTQDRDNAVASRPTLVKRLSDAFGKQYEDYSFDVLTNDHKRKLLIQTIVDLPKKPDGKKHRSGIDITELMTSDNYARLTMSEYGYDDNISKLSDLLINIDKWSIEYVNHSIALTYGDNLNIFLSHRSSDRFDVLTYASEKYHTLLTYGRSNRERFIKLLLARLSKRINERVTVGTIHTPCLTNPITVEDTEVCEVHFEALPYLVTNTRKNIKLKDVRLKRTNTPHGLDMLNVSGRTCMGVLLDFDEPLEALEILQSINQSMEDIYILVKNGDGYTIKPYHTVN